ncbi:uncharacterized protein Z520_08735 [Fonsecaea multimorphosa CBS 102226]|uniref:N-acetyltransferase domain-containing protein n=1 Tax=Fonsecaea multimorphosa CBS 102226 TaxID=1442371 RepID=A0A0D2H196_9EURO|nr:uncharacterized protein Z520_08735 [Fonsecaea multimorphosa CBS 102226]KIX95615.1 hypothetical protein Z520_08735 [Fonsecaea multimorphosa CBS 102226]OAL21219.1 hypothetical protein AYO22_08182 [Fonsecaea multimorphosa]
MASFSVQALPNPAPDHDTFLEYSSRLKTLRLRSLKEHAKSFISRYESEVSQPEEFWLNRLRDNRATHLILLRHNALTHESTLLQNQWVGFVVITAPTRKEVDDVGRSSSAEWYMAALYVEPEVRGQGLGKRLVQATIDHVRDNSSREHDESPCCLTSVVHGNENALELYQKLGFRIINPKEEVENEGRKYLSTKMRIEVY